MSDIYNLLNNATNEKIEEKPRIPPEEYAKQKQQKDRIFMIWLRSKHMKLFLLHKII